MNEQQPFDPERSRVAQGKEAGWEMTIPKFLLNPLVWIIVVILVFGGYQLVRTSPKNNVDQEFKALCEKDFGKDAWMSMKPMKDGKELSDAPCWGCMVDDNNMTCDRNEYENLGSKKSSAVQKQSLLATLKKTLIPQLQN